MVYPNCLLPRLLYNMSDVGVLEQGRMGYVGPCAHMLALTSPDQASIAAIIPWNQEDPGTQSIVHTGA